MHISELVKMAHENAKEKGFWDDWEGSNKLHATATRLALIHSEVSEALEAMRHNDKENFEEELADTCIRIFDLCGGLGIDLEKAIIEKMVRNEKRPYKHGKEF